MSGSCKKGSRLNVNESTRKIVACKIHLVLPLQIPLALVFRDSENLLGMYLIYCYWYLCEDTMKELTEYSGTRHLEKLMPKLERRVLGNMVNILGHKRRYKGFSGGRACKKTKVSRLHFINA
jgi:hypothetical protein